MDVYTSILLFLFRLYVYALPRTKNKFLVVDEPKKNKLLINDESRKFYIQLDYLSASCHN